VLTNQCPIKSYLAVCNVITPFLLLFFISGDNFFSASVPSQSIWSLRAWQLLLLTACNIPCILIVSLTHHEEMYILDSELYDMKYFVMATTLNILHDIKTFGYAWLSDSI
jgi:hypothetical protein